MSVERRERRHVVAKSKKIEELEQQLAELTADVQRTRADFENYRKRVEAEKQAAQELGQTKAVMKLLPVIDTVELATAQVPADLAEHPWVKGVAGLSKQLAAQLKELNLERIQATPGVVFNPEEHQAVQFDDEAEGETEVIAEELRTGYRLNGAVIRDAMVKVTRR
ncbi:MAG: nucleotide exchange factor GrpE [Candidatus Saccharibacteria bacterium]|nr:nucleotide exchange factor GrpE [Candidatus Saccharibacteria bacterium]